MVLSDNTEQGNDSGTKDKGKLDKLDGVLAAFAALCVKASFHSLLLLNTNFS